MTETPRDPDEQQHDAEEAEALEHARRPLSGFDALLLPSAVQTADLWSFVSSVSETVERLNEESDSGASTSGES